MGAWGPGPFDNDMAEDWADMLCADKDLKRLKRTLIFKDDTDHDCAAIAAAEVLAALRGHPMRGLSDELKEWISYQERNTDEHLQELAVSTVELILDESELKSLWEGDSRWEKKLKNVLERLAKPPKGGGKPKKRSSFDPEKDTPKNMTQAAKVFKHIEVYPDYTNRRVTYLMAMSNDELDDQYLEYLSLMPDIERLSFKDCDNITAKGLMLIAAVPNLTAIHFDRIKVTEEFIKALSDRGKIDTLNVGESGFVDDWLVHLEKLPNLSYLELDGNPITNAGCKNIGKLKNLDTLYLNDTKVTAEGIASLKDLPRLEMLGLFRTAVDSSVVPILAEMKQLKAVLLRASQITREAVKDLRRQRRDLSVNM